MKQTERPGFLISRLAYLFRLRVEDLLAENDCELSAEESALLMVLVESGQPLRRGEFAEIMLRDKTTITRQLDGLVAKGLVRRKQDPSDGRAFLIYPTSKGTRQINKILPAAKALRESLKQGLTAEEWEIGMKAMRQMKDNLIQLESEK
ncbi:MarR family winged helix-turn-helix transcriptional regulator [Gimesia maris]|uniref:DNA-binding transcriptional repressor MarR n=1 Tax=Gimesia maris TaxID=122 RepID=A0ABX5YHN9_9PLAN|nr:MarR family transcriptional regulator [Gimesia maris]EDL59534.1 probable transcription regulator marR family protein [Gimesia maris DSM 8797]QEG15115.1 DNA-binding transcriptional repressor MarR [Gimesia maris]QGQ31536.1 MarR family transcriptional regulator [Gimesia maris]|tara:strand:- start:4332 stop:4778 length:447 start_codon:yes stop_codon:yes gene_type:complete